MKTFEDLVESWEVNASGALDSRDVHLKDGRHFYTRYRFGIIRLTRDDDLDGHMVMLHYGTGEQSVLTDDEWKGLFLKLVRLHPDIDTTGSTELTELVSAAEASLVYLTDLRSDPMWRNPVLDNLVSRLRTAVRPFDSSYS